MNTARGPRRSRRLIVLAILLLALVCVPPYGRTSAEARIYYPVSEAQKQCLKTAAWPEDESSPLMNSDIPKSRVVNIGFEDVTSADPTRIPAIARELNSVNATGVSISVGRLDWIGFPWDEYKTWQSEEVVRTGRDYVGEAIEAFICSDSGQRRTISLNIDTLSGREIEVDPQIAGINAEGVVSKNWVSISAWKNTDLTERLERLTSEIVHRYSPDSINITEMMFPSYTFSEADYLDFQNYSGLSEWPHRADGTINTESELIYQWRCDAVASIIDGVANQLVGSGVQLTMDVRSPINADLRGRRDSGQDYEQLLKIVDRLNIWNFQGINSTGYYATNQLASFYVDQDPSRFGIEIGLWDDQEAISANVLEHELSQAEQHNVPHLSVTPTSLMDHEAWDTLRRIWGSPDNH